MAFCTYLERLELQHCTDAKMMKQLQMLVWNYIRLRKNQGNNMKLQKPAYHPFSRFVLQM